MTPSTAGLRVEFDEVNKLSRIRVEGRLTDQSLADISVASQENSGAINACACIVDLSSVSEFAVTAGFIRKLAAQKSKLANAQRLCFIVAPQTHAYGLCRMFQILAEATRPLLQIVHTVGEAFEAIGIQSPHFESSVVPATFGAGIPGPVIA
jgi:hypothetical protein